MMIDSQFSISLEKDAMQITEIIQKISYAAIKQKGFNALESQFKMYVGEFPGTSFADQQSLVNQYEYQSTPKPELFSGNIDPKLLELKLHELKASDIKIPCILNRKPMILQSDSIPDKTLNLKFISADTEELKNVEFSFMGDRAVFKVGEGEQNHYQIPNDKKLMDS